MVRSAFRRVSNHEGSRRRHSWAASWFETPLRGPHHEANEARQPLVAADGGFGVPDGRFISNIASCAISK